MSLNHLFHSSAHCFPTSLNIIRSSQEQGVTYDDVLHINGLEPGKIASGMKLTIIIWMVFAIHTFVLSYFKIKLHNV